VDWAAVDTRVSNPLLPALGDAVDQYCEGQEPWLRRS
jgi:hypothetical protein